MFTATVSVPVEEFALGHALREAPEMDVEVERLAAHSTLWVMPCLWAAGGDFDAFDAALVTDPTVEEVVTAAAFGDEKYYQIVWTDEVTRHVDAGLDREAALLHAETTDGRWTLRARFATREQFEAFREHFSAEGIDFRLQDLTRSTAPRQQMGGLTSPQRDALVAAVEAGYFAVPRDATMEDVAEALGVSSQAASERLRRGIEQFVQTTLIVSGEGVEV